MCVPVCELIKTSSMLYPSFFISAHLINWGDGDPGNASMSDEIVIVRSAIPIYLLGYTIISTITKISNYSQNSNTLNFAGNQFNFKNLIHEYYQNKALANS